MKVLSNQYPCLVDEPKMMVTVVCAANIIIGGLRDSCDPMVASATLRDVEREKSQGSDTPADHTLIFRIKLLSSPLPEKVAGSSCLL